jgi:hypothetical protein
VSKFGGEKSVISNFFKEKIRKQLEKLAYGKTRIYRDRTGFLTGRFFDKKTCSFLFKFSFQNDD